ncbi:type 1 glutamine amidotransferase [Fannyhessea vaginae]|uniref:type 1 glutamine amidotransferase n=1 Tax=Fannyhessea vaginae TaxID=82135 RepID=UPI003A811251
MQTLRIVHMYPELLNLYGDSGNMLVLAHRLKQRQIPFEIVEVHVGDSISLSSADIVFIGGGSDREQKIVCSALQTFRDELASYVEDGGVLAAVCGGYQLLGHYYLLDDEKIKGLSLVDLYTDRGTPRLIGNIAIKSSICPHPIVGYENHGGRTHLAGDITPLGVVEYGHGNDGETGYEGCLYKHVLGTYIHGPLFPKNPGVADFLLRTACVRRGICQELEPLDDTIELQANDFMYQRLMKHGVRE